MSDTLERGWAKPSNSRKWHYFDGARALCNRWLYFGDILETDQSASPNSNDCAACRKRAPGAA